MPLSSAKLYIDMDDVLCETARALTALAAREFGKTVELEELTTFNLERALDLTSEQTELLMYKAHQPEILGKLKPRDGALAALTSFVERSIEIVVVTGRPPSSGDVSIEWLLEHRMPHDDFVHMDKYGRLEPADSTVRVLQMHEVVEQRFTLAVEDAGEVAATLAGQYGLPVALLDRPWNRLEALQDLEADGLVTRCTGWPEVEQLVHGMLES
ncbi:MAG: hypothetical protein O2923_06980 [Verrucomicrobia bacterium]|nr:hypothetical protein [Verrucomicrobiota bacterium]MDA1086179.1 hypothetical protein [Verrucomicrobiota bacterium]